ncbi:MAG: amidase domain-containing protein [Sporichthyaceae bacterium]
MRPGLSAPLDRYSRTFIKTRATLLRNIWDVLPGDVIQIDYEANGTVDHALIVTARTPTGSIFVSQNSAWRHNKNLKFTINDAQLYSNELAGGGRELRGKSANIRWFAWRL